MTNKQIKVKSIIFEWSEASHIIKKDTIVNTFEAANNLIFDVAFDMQRHNEQGYRKTSFIIEWEDGRTHEGRIDIQQSHFNKRNPLGEHVKYFYESLAGMRKPHNWTEEEYKNNLKIMYNIDEKGIEEMKKILDTYLLEDVSEPVDPITESVENEEVDSLDIPEVVTIEKEDKNELKTVKNELNTQKHITKKQESAVTEQQESSQDKKETKINYKLNDEKNGVEIYFMDKPSEEIRSLLKANKFRYSKRGFWYAKQSNGTISFAESLVGEKIENDYNNQDMNELVKKVEYPEIEIDDCLEDKYNIPQVIQDREHDANWIFRRNKKDYNKEIREIFTYYTEHTKEILDNVENEYYRFKIKESLQQFKKKYHSLLVKWLSQKGNTPHWAVSGRGNLNTSSYNKKMEQQNKTMLELAALPEEFKNKLNYYKNKVSKEKEKALKQQLQDELKQPLPELTFKVITKEVDLYGNGSLIKSRFYECDGYITAKLWGAWRVYKGDKEIYSTKSQGTLKDAKAYIQLMIKKERQVS